MEKGINLPLLRLKLLSSNPGAYALFNNISLHRIHILRPGRAVFAFGHGSQGVSSSAGSSLIRLFISVPRGTKMRLALA